MTDENRMDEMADSTFEIELPTDEMKRLSFDVPREMVKLYDCSLKWSEMERAEALRVATLKVDLGDVPEVFGYAAVLAADKEGGRQLLRDFFERMILSGRDWMARSVFDDVLGLEIPELSKPGRTTEDELRFMDGSPMTLADKACLCERNRRVKRLMEALEKKDGVLDAALGYCPYIWECYADHPDWTLWFDNIFIHMHTMLPHFSPVLRAIWTHPRFPSKRVWKKIVHYPSTWRQDVLAHLEKHHVADIKNDRILSDRVLSEAVRHGQLATAWRIAKMADGATQKYWTDRIMKVVRE